MYKSRQLIIHIALITVLSLTGIASTAQGTPISNEYPTLTALQAAVVPPADPVGLARRLRGITDIAPPPESAPTRQVGEQQIFWASDTSQDLDFQVTATLRVVGEHIYLWLENGAPIDDADLQALGEAFDNQIYDSVRALWGSEGIPGVDGDPRLHGLFTHGLGSGVAAYFTSRHIYPQEVFPTSNQHEMFFFNLDAIPPNFINSLGVESTLAHEFQHMIRANIQDNDDLWLNEGFSTFTQVYLYNDFGAIPNFLMNPGTQLNTWSEDGARDVHYGAAALFVTYFYERYGIEALQQVSADPGTGLDAFDHVLNTMHEPGVDKLFADWVVANVLLDATVEDGRYSYTLLPDGLISPVLAEVVTTYPHVVNGQASQYATDYTVFDPGDATALNISVATPDTVQLIPTEAASGEWMWYSNRGDVSDMTLTREFDLSGVASATLHYQAWYDIEDYWDFAYLMVSSDGGATWEILPTAHTTVDDPRHAAYGPGYTGVSGGWVQESVSLDAYAGETILVRFEIISDDGISQPGIAIDDMSIPEIGYESDFELDGGGWEAEGWVRIDNRLPQRAWVQTIQRAGDAVSVTRWLAPVDSQWSLPVIEGAEWVVVAVSPFAPETTVSMPYTLSVSK
jgi:immune inhibitor A